MLAVDEQRGLREQRLLPLALKPHPRPALAFAALASGIVLGDLAGRVMAVSRHEHDGPATLGPGNLREVLGQSDLLADPAAVVDRRVEPAVAVREHEDRFV